MGGGGHCKIVVDTLLLTNEYEIISITDLQQNVREKISGISILGTDDELDDYFKKGVKFCFISAGSVKSPHLRVNLFNKAEKIGFKFPNIIHPNAIISQSSDIGEGNYIAPGVIINSGVKIGNHCIINTGAIIDHDCRIEDFVHIAPGAVISGGVEIGKYSHIGAGSSVIQYLQIGKNTVIGAGSVVVKNIGDNVVAFGNPCKEAKENN